MCTVLFELAFAWPVAFILTITWDWDSTPLLTTCVHRARRENSWSAAISVLPLLICVKNITHIPVDWKWRPKRQLSLRRSICAKFVVRITHPRLRWQITRLHMTKRRNFFIATYAGKSKFPFFMEPFHILIFRFRFVCKYRLKYHRRIHTAEKWVKYFKSAWTFHWNYCLSFLDCTSVKFVMWNWGTSTHWLGIILRIREKGLFRK